MPRVSADGTQTNVRVTDISGSSVGAAGAPSSQPVSPTNPVSVVAAQPGSTQKLLQTRWRPESLLNLHALLANPATASQASRTLDFAIQRAFGNDAQLESQIACTQFGQTTVTGSSKSISTGLTTVAQVTASIDNGAAAHNFWVSGVVSQQPGCIDIYVWQPTAAGNTTPIACTTAVLVRWSARGTL